MTNPSKIKEIRKQQREAVTDPTMRQALALEDLADSVEALRAEFVGLSTMLGRVLPAIQNNLGKK